MLRIFEPQFVSDFTDGLACAQYLFFGDVDQPELDMFLCSCADLPVSFFIRSPK